MDGLKSALTSTTIWGGLVTILGVALPFLGYQFGAADQAEALTAIGQVIAGVSGLVVIVGRVRATKKIGGVISSGE